MVAFQDGIIHHGCRLTKVSFDRGCELPENIVAEENYEDGRSRLYSAEGVVTLITRRMLANLRENEPWLFEGCGNYCSKD